VWSVLYLLMAIALWRIWTVAPPGRRGEPTAWYLVQLTVNALWSWAFFAWHLGGLAMFIIVVLWLLIVATMRAFHKCDRWATWLLAPYLAWVTFASALNFAVWRMNPAALSG
jgi:tryptophan-rich sensory protein